MYVDNYGRTHFHFNFQIKVLWIHWLSRLATASPADSFQPCPSLCLLAPCVASFSNMAPTRRPATVQSKKQLKESQFDLETLISMNEKRE